MNISIILNGEQYSVSQGQTLHGLIDSLQLLSGQALAVAVNRKVISSQMWLEYMLQPDDMVDVVRAIGGG